MPCTRIAWLFSRVQLVWGALECVQGSLVHGATRLVFGLIQVREMLHESDRDRPRLPRGSV